MASSTCLCLVLHKLTRKWVDYHCLVCQPCITSTVIFCVVAINFVLLQLNLKHLVSRLSWHTQVQIRPWKLSDSNFIMDHTQPIDPRKTIFIGGVPRPLKACELADIFNSRYGNVCYAGIDCDPDLKYPKGTRHSIATLYTL